MSLPHSKHTQNKRHFLNSLLWLGSEPYRLFFPSGILFSIAGAMLWPLFYHGKLTFHPSINHAHVMIQAFGGAFVIGFLGTAGPRLLTAPRLKPWELIPLFGLHFAGGIFHLRGLTAWADGFFLGALASFMLAFAVRLIFSGKIYLRRRFYSQRPDCCAVSQECCCGAFPRGRPRRKSIASQGCLSIRFSCWGLSWG